MRRPTPEGKIKAALPWAFAEGLFSALLSFLLTLITARLLLPSDFGLATIAIAVPAVIQGALITGPMNALVRLPHVDTEVTDSAFWAILGLGFLGSLLCAASAAPLAAFYDNSHIVELVAVNGLSCILVAVAAVPTAMLTRRMRGRTLTLRTLLLRIITLVVTGILAYAGTGAWAIVVGSLAGLFGAAIALWAGQPRRPKFRFSAQLVMPTLKLGWLIGLETLLNLTTVRAVLLLYGRFHGIEALGLANFGIRLVDEIANVLTTMATRTTVAYFAAIKRTGGDAVTAFIRGSNGATILGAPIFLGIAAVAPTLVPLVFGDHWINAVLPTQAIALLWAIRFTRILAPGVLVAHGVQGPLLVNAAIGLTVGLVTTLITSRSGAEIALLAFVLPSLVNLPAGAYYLQRTIGLSPWSQIRAVAAPFTSALVMLAAVIAVREYALAPGASIMNLALEVLTGIGAYGLSLLVLDRHGVTALLKMTLKRS